MICKQTALYTLYDRYCECVGRSKEAYVFSLLRLIVLLLVLVTQAIHSLIRLVPII